MSTPASDGPDLSHHQWPVAWSLLPTYRLMTVKLTDGVSYPADKLAKHVAMFEAIRQHGTRWCGTYHWLRGSSSAKAQADFYISTLVNRLGGLARGELVQLDWETTAGTPVPTGEMVEEWCDRVEQAIGRECVIVYSSDWLPDSTLDPDLYPEMTEWRHAHPERPYWHANYNLTASSTGGAAECAKYDASVWQWTSKASVPGIVGGVDMNAVLKPAVLDRLCDLAPPPIGDAAMTPEQEAKLDALANKLDNLEKLVWAVAADVAAIKNRP